MIVKTLKVRLKEQRRKAKRYRKRFESQEREHLTGNNSRYTLQGRKSLR